MNESVNGSIKSIPVGLFRLSSLLLVLQRMKLKQKRRRCGSIQKSFLISISFEFRGCAFELNLKFVLLPFCCTHNSFPLLGFVIKSHSFHLVLITMVPSVCLHQNTTCLCFAETNFFRRSINKATSDGEVTNYKMSPFLFRMVQVEMGQVYQMQDFFS